MNLGLETGLWGGCGRENSVVAACPPPIAPREHLAAFATAPHAASSALALRAPQEAEEKPATAEELAAYEQEDKRLDRSWYDCDENGAMAQEDGYDPFPETARRPSPPCLGLCS